jgi:hypothetical protein
MDDNGLDWSVVTDPFRDFVETVFEYLPRVVAALVLFLVFWIGAKILSWFVRKSLKKSKVDERLAKGQIIKDGEKYPVANGVATAVYWLVWLFYIPVVLGVLRLEGLLGPVESMFEKLLLALPNIVGAILVLVVAYIIGRLAATLVTGLLTRAGFNRVLVNLGLTKNEPSEDQLTPSKFVGYAVLTAIMLLAATAAAELLNFQTVTRLVEELIEFLGGVVLGIVVIGLGIFLANLAAKAIRASGRAQAGTLAMLAQVAILLVAGAMGLRAMGFANEIVIIGFGVVVGAIAVAFALAFGLGGREVAGRELDRWSKAMRSEKPDKNVKPEKE